MGRMIKFGFILVVTSAVCSGLLAYVNEITHDEIAKMDKKIENSARKTVLPDADRFDEGNMIKSGGYQFIPGIDKNGQISGYAVLVKTTGYGANGISFVLGINSQKKISGLKITDSSTETPGLGSKINDAEWQKKWIGRDKSYKFDKKIDGFAGATISPEGVYSGAVKALKVFSEINFSGGQ